MISRRAFLNSLLATGASLPLAGASLPAFGQSAGGFDLGFDPGDRYAASIRSQNNYSLLSQEVQDATRAMISAYRNLVYRGGWPVVPSGSYYLGLRHPNVRILRARLWASGDLQTLSGDDTVFDSYVADAVKLFQSRHGLITDGAAARITLAAMNVPAEARLAQLLDNYEMLTLRKPLRSGRDVVVNLPAARIEAVEDGKVKSYHAGVVGKPERQSPEIDVNIVAVNFNPYWTVPRSIIERDLIPTILKDPGYLERNRLRLSKWNDDKDIDPATVDWNSPEAKTYRFRQDPFEGNSLGTMRINMPNKHAVYMHDTPSKTLFGSDYRFHSSGCVRVQKVHDFATWLLAETKGWDRNKVKSVARSSERVDASLRRRVPVHWVYFTAWAEVDGIVHFRDDIYNKYSGGFAEVTNN